MKKNISEAYPYRKSGNSGASDKKKRYVKIYAKRIVNKQDDSQADPSTPQNTTELVQITLQNVDIVDGKQIQESIVPNAKVFMGTTNTTKGPIKVPTISFIVPSPPTQIKRCLSCEMFTIERTYSVASPGQVV